MMMNPLRCVRFHFNFVSISLLKEVILELMHLPCDAVTEIVQRHFSEIYDRIDRYMLHDRSRHQLSIPPSENKVYFIV